MLERLDDKTNRIQEKLPYLDDTRPETRIIPPLKSRMQRDVLIVGDDISSDFLRLERNKDYMLVEVTIFNSPNSQGRITVGGPRRFHKNITLFYSEKKTFGNYCLFEGIRGYGNPHHDIFPAVVIRFWGEDPGVVYLDPLGSGKPQAVVEFSSVSMKK